MFALRGGNKQERPAPGFKNYCLEGGVCVCVKCVSVCLRGGVGGGEPSP